MKTETQHNSELSQLRKLRKQMSVAMLTRLSEHACGFVS